jgi:predicted TIM-barrel fold metal-dependent hydrolase
MSAPLRVCDPHFHLWNLHERPNPNLGTAVAEQLPAYLAADYLEEMGRLPVPLELSSSVHVETVVGQMDGGFALDPVAETRWVCEQMESTGHPFGVVAYVHLARDSAETERALRQHEEAGPGRLRGVRMIVNHHADNADLTWPQVASAGFLRDPMFGEGIALLGERGLSFDLQCNPHQLEDAARTFGDHPRTPVVLDHLGSFHDGEDEMYTQMWREGMAALASVPHAFVKLSMLFFCAGGYHQDVAKETKVKDLVREVIELFGCDRCMFASNFPVDRIMGIPLEALYGKFLEWTVDLADAERAALFHDTAVRAYRL